MDATLPRIAPSRLGASMPAIKPMPIGPSGLAIPPARTLYRRADGMLLGKLAKAAYDAWTATELPPAAWDEARAALEADLDHRFPAADMAVLERYDLAAPCALIIVAFDAPYRRPLQLGMATRTLPFRAANFTVDGTAAASRVPVAQRPFFARFRAIETQRNADLDQLLAWPGRFHVEKGLWPRWREIEDAWPKLGTWLAAERIAIEEKHDA